MKATGIVRRIDDLGRVVITKEIRRTMRIRGGDPLSIHTVSWKILIGYKILLIGLSKSTGKGKILLWRCFVLLLFLWVYGRITVIVYKKYFLLKGKKNCEIQC